MKNIYFGSEADYEEHALNERDVPGSVIWVGMHFPLTFSLLGCGVGYKLVFTAIHDGEGPLGNLVKLQNVFKTPQSKINQQEYFMN